MFMPVNEEPKSVIVTPCCACSQHTGTGLVDIT